jgi:hypothetical protein
VGSFYTSHTLRGPSPEEVLGFLKSRSALVSRSENGCVTVLDEACESQDGEVLAELAHDLSERFQCPVLAVLNHDDDILYFELYEDGQKTDEYNSAPGYFNEDAEDDRPVGGDAKRLSELFGAADPGQVEAILRSGEYVFALERHRDLAEALSLPPCSIGIGYTYASAGELPPGVQEGTYVHTGG